MPADSTTLEHRILVLAPLGNDAPVTLRLLSEAGIAAHRCKDLTDLLERVREGCAGLLIAEEALSENNLAPFVQHLSHQPSWSDIPIIIITTSGDSKSFGFQRMARLGVTGNVTLLERPFRPLTLVNAAQVAIRSRRRQYEVRDLLSERERLLAGLEEKVQNRTAELQATNAQLEELVYSIAHDLRAPLRAMQGFSKLLVDQYGSVLEGDGREYADRVMLAAERMDAMTLDLLAYGRMARSDISLTPVSIKRVWEMAASQCEKMIEETGAKVEVIEPLPTVLGEEPILTQVFANLLNNALKFVRDGEKPEVRVRCEPGNPKARIWVEDKGIGIPEQYHERVFRVFERLDGAKFSGTGIGLSIVRKGVERMGGRVGVESNGTGSKFWIELPIAA
jgi:signal transduction histidine kinase